MPNFMVSLFTSSNPSWQHHKRHYQVILEVILDLAKLTALNTKTLHWESHNMKYFLD